VQRRRVAPRVPVEQPGLAGVGTQQAEQHPDRGRLSGTVRAEEPVHLTGADLEVQTVEGDRLPEGLPEAGDHDRDAHSLIVTQIS
jgi:hypothetical protein